MTPDLQSLRRQAGTSTTPPPAVESWNSEIEHRIDQQVPEPPMDCGTVIGYLVVWSIILVVAYFLVVYVVFPLLVAVLPWVIGIAILVFIIGALSH